MVNSVLQLRRLAIATAMAFVLAVGLGSISFGSVPGDEASGASEAGVFEVITALCDGQDCADHEGCLAQPAAGCCHDSSVSAVVSPASLDQTLGSSAWVPQQNTMSTGTGPEVGRHPPRF